MTSVSCTVQIMSAEELEFVGVLAPMAAVLDHLLLPDGRRGHDIEEHVSAVCKARRRETLAPQEPWRTLVVRVTAKVPGFKELGFDWKPAEGAPRDRLLELK